MAAVQQISGKTVRRRGLTSTGERVVPRPSQSVIEDDVIRLAVQRLLGSSDYQCVRELRSLVEDGVVMLFGTVPSYYVKQIVQTVVMKLELVERVENHCKVE